MEFEICTRDVASSQDAPVLWNAISYLRLAQGNLLYQTGNFWAQFLWALLQNHLTHSGREPPEFTPVAFRPNEEVVREHNLVS